MFFVLIFTIFILVLVYLINKKKHKSIKGNHRIHYSCNNCFKEIHKHRYNCVSCPVGSFDLCETCYFSRKKSIFHDSDHRFDKIFISDQYNDPLRSIHKSNLATTIQSAFFNFSDRDFIVEVPQQEGYDQLPWISYKECYERILNFGHGLQTLPKVFVRDKIGICSDNSIEWIISDYALLLQSFVVVPLPTKDMSQVEQIIKKCKLTTIICSPDYFTSILTMSRETCDFVKYLILTKDYFSYKKEEEQNKTITILSFKEVEKKGEKIRKKSFWTKEIIITPKHEPLSIVFTSGSTNSKVKGAVWTDENMNLVACESFIPEIVVLDFQPQYHAFSRKLVLRTICNGGQIGIHVQDKTSLEKSILQIRPTFFGASPAFWSHLYSQYQIELTKKINEYKKNNDYSILNITYEQLKKKAIKELKFGMRLGNRLKSIVVGGAIVEDHIKQFIQECFNVHVADGYSLTETGTISIDGKIASDVDIILCDVDELGYSTKSSKGEICVRTPRNISEYYEEEELTKKSFISVNGKKYFRTGDIGEMINGKIKIIDRISHIFKLSNGEFVSPVHIESIFESIDLIDEVLIWGDSRKSSVVAIVVLSFLFWSSKNDDEITQEDKIEILSKMAQAGVASGLKTSEIPLAIHIEKNKFPESCYTESGKRNRNKLVYYYQKYLSELYNNTENYDSDYISNPTFKRILELNNLLFQVIPVEAHKMVNLEKTFVEIGGDSLSAVRFSKLLSHSFNISVSVTNILQSRSLNDLETMIQHKIDGTSTSYSIIPQKLSTTSRDWNIECEFKKEIFINFIQKEEIRLCSEIGNLINYKKNLLRNDVLLTSGVGFMGPFMIKDILKNLPDSSDIFCIVRAVNHNIALKRLEQESNRMGCWDDILKLSKNLSRLHILTADVSKDQFGLDNLTYFDLITRVKYVYHNAAQVHSMFSYEILKQVNVIGTLNVLYFLCLIRPKILNHISSIAVLKPPENFPEIPLNYKLNSEKLIMNLNSMSGYPSSKFVAEVLLTKATIQLKSIKIKNIFTDNDNNDNDNDNDKDKNRSVFYGCSIFRPSTISANTKTGCGNIRCFTTIMICGMIKLKGFPASMLEKRGDKLKEGVLWFTPIDFVSESIVKLGFLNESFYQKNLYPEIYHLVTPTPLFWKDVVSFIRNFGYEFNAYSVAEWKEKIFEIDSQNPLFMFREQLLFGEVLDVVRKESPQILKTQKICKENEIECPIITQSIFHLFLSFLVSLSMIPDHKK